MMEDYSRDLLRTGLIEMKGGNRAAARRYIDRALYMTSDHDALAEGWYWMSELTDDPAQKRLALENCLSHDLRHARARRALAILDGKLKPDEIIDPEAAAAAPAGAVIAEAQRFMCPKCGARMHFGPDGQSLLCDYCARNLALPGGEDGGERGSEKDFLLAMATARGHGKPLAEQVFGCNGCGVQFFLPPAQLSVTCPYCGSPHVVSFEKSPGLLAPDAIIPHAFEQQRAAALLERWLAQRLPPDCVQPDIQPRGLYVPVWAFDIGGAIDYTAEVIQDQGIAFGRRAVQREHIADRYPVALASLPIPASRKLSGPFIRLLHSYDLRALQAYDPRFLVDWPAELYDIPMADASLDARSQAYALLKRDMSLRMAQLQVLSTSSAGLVVDAFRLALIPVWVAEVTADNAKCLVLINGQTGDIYGDIQARPSHSGKLLSWLSDLVGE